MPYFIKNCGTSAFRPVVFKNTIDLQTLSSNYEDFSNIQKTQLQAKEVNS